jgi:erythromycin esterase
MQTRFIIGIFSIILISCESETEKWSEWIQDNSHGIALNDTSNYEDLQFLGDILGEKRIVFLGESGHGVAEYTILKSRIIKYLHEELDFDILAFESNSADAFAADYFGSYSNADSTIYNSISTLWHVEEIVPLFRFINSTHSANDPLIVQGVDITQSNGSYAFSKFLYQLILPIDPFYARELKYKDSIFSAQGVKRWTIGNIFNENEHELFRKIKKERLGDYSSLKEYIQQNREQFNMATDREIAAAVFYVQSRIDFIHWSNRDSTYMVDVLKGTRYERVNLAKLHSAYRDYLMAQNLRFLAEILYPNKKIIVWSQNAHIKKYQKRMSYELNEVAPTYSIAIFCYSGEGDWTFGQGFDGEHPDSMIYQFKTPQDPLNIGKILHASGHEITLIDMENQIKSERNSWMFDMAKTHDWDGSGLEELENIRNVWDALILVNETRTPKYLEYEYDYLGQGTKGYNKR